MESPSGLEWEKMTHEKAPSSTRAAFSNNSRDTHELALEQASVASGFFVFIFAFTIL
jgi:hypothetical protein